ncbi:MAG: metallophosphoesterase [Nanoarchaeota archaeon]|nr:metallophosphoesterase [Nanoarchaeota archaeon]MBU1632319.1 metallophosphoesterase [Nanoarchaeota archaeon]MBU1875878.1 metallophosphoesterase [Nanoarchaeota archaeon]
MQICKGIEIIDNALWFNKKRTLIISDVHIGYEEALHNRGIMVPKSQLDIIFSKLKLILKKVNPKEIIINGDLKHEFGKVLRQEWKEVLSFLDFLSDKCKKIIIVQGNHDPIIKTITDKREIKIVKEIIIGDTLIVHGDMIRDNIVDIKAKRIIIGHEHPAITIREGSKGEKYKCFLKGKWKGKELISMPSFNPLLEGTDILKEELLSPFLKDVSNFKVYVVNNMEIFDFGKVKDLKH